MLASLESAAVRGMGGFVVQVEIHLANGLPSFAVVGLPDGRVREARERVVSAVRNSGFEFPSRKTTVNLAPADWRKNGTHFDLPMALGLLTASGQAKAAEHARRYCVLGELALDGAVRPVVGVLAMAAAARHAGCSGVITSRENAPEAAAIGVPAYGVASLKEAADFWSGRAALKSCTPSGQEAKPAEQEEDFSEVCGQSLAKRALEISAAGGHNLLMVGPPGTGKSMLARRFPGILPPFGREESVEVSAIYSVAGKLSAGRLMRLRPFRSPHATATPAALVGGGWDPRPGEVTLAHRGVLFLDEMPEFSRAALEALRQPLEDRNIQVGRLRGAVTYPADFVLVAAMNPCPCGYLGSRQQACRCPEDRVMRYRSRLSGPLLDRIDLQVELAPVPFAQWSRRTGSAEPTESVRRRVVAARKFAARMGRPKGNGTLRGRFLSEHCRLDGRTRRWVEKAAGRRGFSARALDRLLRVARTISDLEGSQSIQLPHMSEAFQYRALDQRPDMREGR